MVFTRNGGTRRCQVEAQRGNRDSAYNYQNCANPANNNLDSYMQSFYVPTSLGDL
jgi:hypothetical protein